MVDMNVGEHQIAFDITFKDFINLKVEMFDRKNLLDIQKIFPQISVNENKRLEVLKIKIQTNKIERHLVTAIDAVIGQLLKAI